MILLKTKSKCFFGRLDCQEIQNISVICAHLLSIVPRSSRGIERRTIWPRQESDKKSMNKRYWSIQNCTTVYPSITLEHYFGAVLVIPLKRTLFFEFFITIQTLTVNPYYLL